MSRSKWKGQYTDHFLLKKIKRIQKLSGKQKQKQNYVIRTWSRRSTITNDFVGYTFQIHNGKSFKSVTINPDMVGHKLGEFAVTRKPLVHKKKAKK
jgi:small subunit ribosomal protein S19